MTKGFYFGTSILKTCIRRLLDLFFVPSLPFGLHYWEYLVNCCKWMATCLRLLFYAFSHEGSEQTQWKGKGRRGLHLFPREEYWLYSLWRMEDLTSKKCIPKEDVVYIWKMRNNCYICWKLFIEQKNVQHYRMVKLVALQITFCLMWQ